MDDNVLDVPYVPPEISITPEIDEQSSENLSSIETLLGTSPVRFKIKRKFVDDLSDSSIKYLRKKYTEAIANVRQTFVDSVAPGQGDELMSLLEESASSEDISTPAELQHLVKKYMKSDNLLGQMIVLSLVDHNKYTKKEILVHFPGSTMYQVNQARKWNKKETFSLPQKVKHKRTRLDISKCEHFLNFIFSTGLLQDVAYGVTTIKFDSGEEQKLAHAILTTKYNHAILFYYQMCKVNGYQPLSKSTLFSILKALKPSQRKNLSGLDDIQAAAMNGFEKLANLSKSLEKDINHKLEEGKRYLKTKYQQDCSTVSELATHNQHFALSDKKDELHMDTCVNTELISASVFDLFCAMDCITKFIEEDGDEDKVYETKSSIEDIISYMQHLMRDSQQAKAKVSALEKLDVNTGFWLKDYAQKVLPAKYRETQKDYFGKKGMTLHIDVLLSKSVEEELIKHVYYTVAYRCDQGLDDTLCITENVLKQIKKDVPEVTKIFMKSDNASCYHGNYSAELNHFICKQENIRYEL